MEIQPRTAPRHTTNRKTVYADERWRPTINLQDAPVKVNNGNDANKEKTLEDIEKLKQILINSRRRRRA